jgi:hypothetical protein
MSRRSHGTRSAGAVLSDECLDALGSSRTVHRGPKAAHHRSEARAGDGSSTSGDNTDLR